MTISIGSTSPTGRLAGRVAYVTGGAHGIGRAFCMRFAAEGAAIAVLDLDAAGAESVVEDIRRAGGTAYSARVDVSDPEFVAETIAAMADEAGSADILVNNAAMFSVVPMSRAAFDEITVDEWDRMMAINTRGPWLMGRAVAPAMKSAGYGKIINMSSMSAFRGGASQIHYVTSKGAVNSFTYTLARELGPYGITVNALAPGSTLSEESPSEETVQFRRQGVVGRAIPRLQTPDDIVGAAVFLASGDSDFITGQTLIVDGGLYMR